jgi:hypothetical protein
MVKRLRIEAEEAMRFNPMVRELLSRSILLRCPSSPASSTAEATAIANRLCQAARLAPSDSMMRSVEARIDSQLTAVDPLQIPWKTFFPDYGPTVIQKGVILKPYVSEREKGVVFISFDNQFARLASSSNLAEFRRRYTVVFAPVWCPPHTMAAYLVPRLFPDEKIFCLISNVLDLTYLPRISSRYEMVPLYSSSWVDPRKYTPVPVAEKNIDIFMLANFAKYKRHHALFAALRDMPRGLRIVLNGQRERGRTKETILAEAAAYGVQDRFEIKENVSEEELHDNLVHAKTSLILSRREGSCVAVVESMFANTPVGLYEDAEVGSRAFVNASTGRLLQHENLGAQLTDFVKSSASYEPRKWVMENGVSCIASSQVLNEALKRDALETGGEWTRDIATLRWRPNPEYYDPQEAVPLLPSYRDILERCGLQIGAYI